MWLRIECSAVNGGISVPVEQKGTITCMYMIDVVEFNHDPTHDDVIKLKHFTRYWPFVRGIHRSPVNSPHKGQWRGALMFSLICAWINGWVNNGEAADLRRHRTHYDVIVMTLLTLKRKSQVKWPHPKWCWGLLIKYTKLANVGTMSTIDTSKVYLIGIISPQLEPYWKPLTPQIIIELWRPDYAVRHITFDRVELMICQGKVLVWAPEQRNRHRPDPATPPFLTKYLIATSHHSRQLATILCNGELRNHLISRLFGQNRQKEWNYHPMCNGGKSRSRVCMNPGERNGTTVHHGHKIYWWVSARKT